MLKAVVTTSWGVVTAAASALCCAGPLLAVTAGVSGAGLSTTFEPLRPYLLAATGIFLPAGFYLLDREDRMACESDKPCADPVVQRRTKIMLWVATITAVIFAQIPNHEPMADAQHHGDDGHDHPVMTEPTSRLAPTEAQHVTTVHLNVTGMTWPGCSSAARMAVERVAGVFPAEFDNELGAGRVTHDPEETDPAPFISELERMTGFQAAVSESTIAEPRWQTVEDLFGE